VKFIHYSATLLYYDGVQIFEGKDEIGGHYIALLVESKKDGDLYVIVGVKPEQLREFQSGLLDLREVILKRPEKEWYLGRVADDFSSPIFLELQTQKEINQKFLPQPGFLLHEERTLQWGPAAAITPKTKPRP